MSVDEDIQAGIAAHSQGQWGEAARFYRRALEADPNNPDALHLMSTLALSGGEAVIAEALSRQAVAAADDWFAPCIGLGNALQAQGRLEEAVAWFHQAITLHPECAEAYSNMSSALCALGLYEDATNAAVNAIVIDGGMAEAHNNFGNALQAQGSPFEAMEAYYKAIALNPDYSDAWYNLANAQVAAAEIDSAIMTYKRAIELSPAPVKHYNLGNALLLAGRAAEATLSFQQALALDPTFVAAAVNLSSAYKELEQLNAAEATLRKYLEIAPDDPDLHWNLALVSLQAGRWEAGWKEYEWRWHMPTFKPFIRDFNRLEWRGEDLTGKSILVHAEQGFGDAIEFSRFVARLGDRAERVVFECRKGLVRLFSTLHPRVEPIALGADLPDTDYVVPMMSLVPRLGLSMEQVATNGAYLTAPKDGQDFSDVICGDGLKVGIVWAGSDTRRDNRIRSGRASDFKEVVAAPGCRFYSLQVGPQSAQIGELGDAICDLTPRFHDFADTAAAIGALDLVISVDTGVAHLAGALNIPVWVLLSKPSNGFLWMLDREDSPWYPSARLFRQTLPGDWSELMGRVTAELSKVAALR